MSIVQRLSSEFVGPVLARFGLEQCPDGSFRKWSEDSDICAIVQIRGDSKWTVEVAFFSRFIWSAWGLENQELPNVAMCNTCGIVFRPDMLSGADQRVPRSWSICGETELAHVGGILCDLLLRKLGPLLQQFMTMEGWVHYFRSEVSKYSKGRGYFWAMLGYSLLALPSTIVDEIQRVIEEHSRQNASLASMNRLQEHLDRQRKMVIDRFGIGL